MGPTIGFVVVSFDPLAALVPLPGHRARSAVEDVFEVGLERMESHCCMVVFVSLYRNIHNRLSLDGHETTSLCKHVFKIL